jgi:hypothetical protein
MLELAKYFYQRFQLRAYNWLNISKLPALQSHYTENSKQIFTEMKLRSLVPNSYIRFLVSDLYIPTIGLPILQQENRWTDRGNI